MDENHGPQPRLPVVTTLPDVGLLIDVGRQSHDQIRRLKRGNGQLAQQLQMAVLQSRKQLGLGSAAEIVPVVVLYRCSKPKYLVITPEV